MSFRLSRRVIWLAATSLVVSVVVVGSAKAQSKERGRPIEFSLPKSDEVTTNLQQLTSKKDSLKQLEEELYKPLESFSPKGSLEGVAAPLPRAPSAPAVPSKRVKDMLEKRKNWVFMSPEDMLGTPTVEDVLKTPEGVPDKEEKNELPAIERYYKRLTTKKVGVDRSLESKNEELFGMPSKQKAREERASGKESNVPIGVRESAQELTKLVEGDSRDSGDSVFTQEKVHDNLSDIFGLGNHPPTKEQVQEHKKFMNEHHSLVDPSWHPPEVATPANLFSTIMAGAALPAAKPAASLPNPLSPAPQTALDAQMDVISPRLGPPGLPDVNAQALGQTRPAPILTTPEPVRVPPPAPNFTAPKRSFY
jgi:hypothetical protein